MIHPKIIPGTERDPFDPATVPYGAIVQIKWRFARYFRHALDAIRSGEREAAIRFLGIAEGQALCLYDTTANAYPYLRAVQKIRVCLEEPHA